MQKITIVFVALSAFFAGVCFGMLLGNGNKFGCDNGTTINNYGNCQ